MKKRFLIVSLIMASLCLSRAATPDAFVNAQIVSGPLVSATNNNQFATTELGEPGGIGYRTLWYSWTAPATGIAKVTTEGSSSFSRVLNIWMGDSLTNLKLVVSGHPVSFPVVAGSRYYLSAGSFYSNEFGDFQLNISISTSSAINALNIIGLATATNDNFANRIITSAELGSYIAYNGSFTREPLELTPGYFTMWWTYRAQATGRLDINDLGDGSWAFSKNISVWSGTSIQNLKLITPIVTAGDCRLPVVAGNDYHVCVSSYYNNESGPIVVTFALDTGSDLASYNLSAGAASTNDNFNSAALLTGATPAIISYNTYATREALEPANNGYKPVWFKWTAPAAGPTQIITQGGDNFSKLLTVYTGTSINALTQVIQPASSINPIAAFTATAGQTYFISLGSYYSNESGSLLLAVFGQPGNVSGPALTVSPAFKIQFPTDVSRTYRVQQTIDFNSWNTLTNQITGDGHIQQTFVDPKGLPADYFRIVAQ